jgi:hypothetical protein
LASAVRCSINREISRFDIGGVSIRRSDASGARRDLCAAFAEFLHRHPHCASVARQRRDDLIQWHVKDANPLLRKLRSNRFHSGQLIECVLIALHSLDRTGKQCVVDADAVRLETHASRQYVL